MSIRDENIENAFLDEYGRLKHEGWDQLIGMRLDELLYRMYKRGYIRGHADRAREEQDARRDTVEVRAEDGVVYIEGKRVHNVTNT